MNAPATFAAMPGTRGTLRRPNGVPAEVAIALAVGYFDLTEPLILGPRLLPHLVDARSWIVWVLRTLGEPLSYGRIGQALGQRDHKTIINLHQRAIRRRIEDIDFNEKCARIAERFHALRSQQNGQ